MILFFVVGHRNRRTSSHDPIACCPGHPFPLAFTLTLLPLMGQVRPDDGPRRLSTVPGAQPQSTTGGGQVSSAKRAPRNRFVWLGPTRRRVVGLGPGEATTIPLKVRYIFSMVTLNPAQGSAWRMRAFL